MSPAQLCGCDPEQDWICEMHRGHVEDADVVEAVQNSTAWRRTAAIEIAALTPRAPQMREATPIEESLIDIQRTAAMLVQEVQTLATKVETLQHAHDSEHVEAVIWRNDRRHIAEVLSAFYRAPVSLSSLQPVLDLAVELNPELKVNR